ncbi:MAG: PQQ-binding-like beta-propeller repeat protein [Thermoplasmata archaeon]|nr:PQQ-binding-like beta-propeller repeat protein [Thermoplasmata archaeon]
MFDSNSDSNEVANNEVTFNGDYGFCIQGSTLNLIHHNHFRNNTMSPQGYDSGSSNAWDDGSEGNWWSDYDGEDADLDGIGDTPYDIDGGSRTDRYPLVPPTFIVVDDDGGRWADYMTLKAALENATDDMTIFLYEGHYLERVDVNKRLRIIGNGTGLTVIDGNGTGTVISMFSDDTSIMNLTVTGAGTGEDDACIRADGTSRVRISNIAVFGGGSGIALWNCTDASIDNCSVNRSVTGIRSKRGSGANVVGCDITSCVAGVELYATDYNAINGSTIAWNRYGINVTGGSIGDAANQCRIHDNPDMGVNLFTNGGYGFDATYCWWDAMKGPYHPVDNPGGSGDEVSDKVDFWPWLPKVRFPEGRHFIGDTGEEITFAASGISIVDIIRYSWYSDIEGALYNGTSSTFSLVFSENRTHNLTVTVQDALGIWSVATSATVRSNGRPAIRRFSASPLWVNEGDTITFYAEAIDDVGITSYEWTYDGIIFDRTSGNTTSWNAFPPGNLTVAVRAVDDNESWSEASSVNISVNELPVATIIDVSTYSAFQGEELTFEGNGTDANGQVVRFRWTSDKDGEFYNGTQWSIAYSGLTNGSHRIWFAVQDEDGAWSRPDEIVISVNGIPISRIIKASEYVSEGDRVRLVGDAIDDGSVSRFRWRSSIDGVLYNGTAPSLNTYDLSNGTHQIDLTVRDQQGLWSEPVVTQVHVDGLPRCRFSLPSMVLLGDNVTFNGTFLDDVGVDTYIWNSSIDGIIGTDRSFMSASLSIGTHEVSLVARDTNGTWGPPATRMLIVNRIPVAIIVSITPSPIVNDGVPVSLVGNGSDDGPILKFSWDSSIDKLIYNGSKGDVIDGLLLSVGTHVITFSVMDEHGTWSTPVNATLRINGIPRVISLLPSSENAIEGENVIITSIVEDDTGIALFSWNSSLDGLIDSSLNSTLNTTSLSNGTHRIYLEVMDEDGVWSTGRSTEVTVNGRPRCRIASVSPNPADNGEPISFRAWAVDDGIISRHLWESSNDGVLYKMGVNSFTRSNLTEGNHRIYLSVRDDDKVWSNRVHIELTVGKPANGTGPEPLATIEGITPNPATVGSDITFHATISGNISYMIWNSSRDGPLHEGPEPIFSARLSRGPHLITLEALSERGEWSGPDTEVVVVWGPGGHEADDPGTDWPQWGRDPGNRNTYSGMSLSNLVALGSIDLNETGSDTIIVSGDIAYVITTAYQNSTLWALDLEHLMVSWNVVTTDSISESPVVVNATIVVAVEDYLWGLNESGAIVWNSSLDGWVNGPLKAYLGTVYVTTWNGILAIDPATGDILWETPMAGVNSVPAIDDLLYIPSYVESRLYALDPETGEVIWSVTTEFDIGHSPVVHDDLLVVATSDFWSYGSIEVLDRFDGHLVWNVTSLNTCSAPLVIGDKVICVLDENVTALSLADGEELWRRNIETKAELIALEDMIVASVSPGFDLETFEYVEPCLKLIRPDDGKIMSTYKFDDDGAYDPIPSMASVWNDTLLVQFGNRVFLLFGGNGTGPDDNVTSRTLYSIKDPAGDVMNKYEKKVGGHPDIDLTDISVILYSNGTIEFSMTVVGDIRKSEPEGEITSYMIVIFRDRSDDTMDPEQGEYNLVCLLGMFQLQDLDLDTNSFIEGRINGSKVTFYVSLSLIGGSTDFRINAIASTFIGGFEGDAYIDMSVGGKDAEGPFEGSLMPMMLIGGMLLLLIVILIIVGRKRRQSSVSGQRRGGHGYGPPPGPTGRGTEGGYGDRPAPDLHGPSEGSAEGRDRPSSESASAVPWDIQGTSAEIPDLGSTWIGGYREPLHRSHEGVRRSAHPDEEPDRVPPDRHHEGQYPREGHGTYTGHPYDGNAAPWIPARGSGRHYFPEDDTRPHGERSDRPPGPPRQTKRDGPSHGRPPMERGPPSLGRPHRGPPVPAPVRGPVQKKGHREAPPEGEEMVNFIEGRVDFPCPNCGAELGEKRARFCPECGEYFG